MDRELIAALEAVLFCSGDPLTMDKLCQVFETTELEISQWLDWLEIDLVERGLELRRFDDSVQLVTKARFTPWIEKLLDNQRPTRLSAPTLETLAIIAYRQPITRPEIEEIRGVKVEKALATLLSYDLITEVGRKETTGRPILYGTTPEFLSFFGILDLSQLPGPRESQE